MLNLRMLSQRAPVYLLASADPGLVAAAGSVLIGEGVTVEIASSAAAVLESMRRADPPDLLLLDAMLPADEIDCFLAAIRAESSSLPVVLIAKTLAEEWIEHLESGVIDDLVLRDSQPLYWSFRAARALHARQLEHEIERAREAAAREAQHDRLTGVLNREALLAAIFRETDRVQRSSGVLSVILFDIDDFGHWNSRLGVDACDEILVQVAARSARLLRSYDLLGRTGKDEFLIALPGCTHSNAGTMAERLRNEVFASPYHLCGESVRLSACFGISQSMGRSPVVVLREAEEAVQLARAFGPESIQYGGSIRPFPPPVTFLSPTSGEELLAW